MSFTLRCPGCAARLTANESMLGKRYPCPKCRAPVSIVRTPDALTHDVSVSRNETTTVSALPNSGGVGNFRTNSLLLPLSLSLLLGMVLLPFAGFGLYAMLFRPSALDERIASSRLAPSTETQVATSDAHRPPPPADSSRSTEPRSDSGESEPERPQPTAEDRAQAIRDAGRLWDQVTGQSERTRAEQARRAREQAERDRLAREQAERERIAREQAERQRSAAADATVAAWKAMNQCNNRFERLSRESPLDYWESLREGYGAIDTTGVDGEFVALLQSFRALFLDYANTLRDWNRERAPLVDALNNAKQPESFGEGLIIGLAGGVAIAAIEEIDKKYKGRLAGLKSRLDSLQTNEATLRNKLTQRYGVSFP